MSDADIERVLAAGSHHSVREGRAVLHSLPIGYALDDNRGIRDPRGMVGQRLGVDMHVVTTDVAAARNLTLLVERCHLGVEAMVAAPYVSGLSVLAEDEADLGAAVIDLGAGTTTIAVFAEGRFVHVDGFALGGLTSPWISRAGSPPRSRTPSGSRRCSARRCPVRPTTAT